MRSSHTTVLFSPSPIVTFSVLSPRWPETTSSQTVIHLSVSFDRSEQDTNLLYSLHYSDFGRSTSTPKQQARAWFGVNHLPFSISTSTSAFRRSAVSILCTDTAGARSRTSPSFCTAAPNPYFSVYLNIATTFSATFILSTRRFKYLQWRSSFRNRQRKI